MQPTPALLPGEFRGQRSLAGCSPPGCKESDTTGPQQQWCSGYQRSWSASESLTVPTPTATGLWLFIPASQSLTCSEHTPCLVCLLMWAKAQVKGVKGPWDTQALSNIRPSLIS